MKFHRPLAVLSLILGIVVSSRAQPAAVQQLENTRQAQEQQVLLPALAVGTNAPELYSGENEDIGPQRILRLNPRPTYFDVLFDSQFFYTDNANFAQNPDMIGSGVFVNTVQAAFAPPTCRLGSGVFASAAGFISQWYNYENNRMSVFDFEAQTFFLSGKYTLGNWQIGLGANYTRLVNQSDYEQSYQEFMPALGVQRIFPMGKNMLLAIGDQVDYHFTSVTEIPTDANDRFDDVVTFTLSWQMTHHLILQPYYHFQYSYYPKDTLFVSDHADRNDFLHTAGITVAYYFNKNLTLRTFFNYNYKQSDDSNTPKYHEYEGGLGVALDFKF